MVDREDRIFRKQREKEKTIRIAHRRREKMAGREEFFYGYLTDYSFAYPQQKDKSNFVRSANGKNHEYDV